ncbi:TKL protein kinase [Phytophthora nicotianae]|uniref:TKL protein kinase n=3 Tax=Phytophthora nicotianae TaxID=4792 RepID=V9FCE3_PHYNI|nr:TKL protein kinase [Phytophthora nicotianae P1569]ETL95587.1 TKL protein kinase [Phytophthora nicotianae]
MYQFWSIYEDSSCDGAPTGVYILSKNDCEDHRASSSGVNCLAQFDNNEGLIGYIDESCYAGRAAGLADLYRDEPYMAYDYYFDENCSDFGNAASYRTSGDCEPLFTSGDAKELYRSATVSVSDGNLIWKRNWGSMDGALHCPGSSGEGYYEFDVPMAEINNGICKKFEGIGGKFAFYNLSEDIDIRQDSGSSLSSSSSSSSSGSSSSSILSSSASDNGLTAGTIIGLACGGVLVLVGSIAILRCICKRRGKSDTRSNQQPFIDRGSVWTGGPTGPTDGSERSTIGHGLWNDNVIIATRVPRDQVVVQGLICRGGFGEIFRGTYNRESVAIKMLFPEMRNDLKKVNDFLSEAKLMAGLVHPHIVRFVGVAWGSLTDLCVLTELMKRGDLRTLLKGYEARGHPQGIDEDKIRIAYHIAQALTYLHSLAPIVIHRDLKSKNVLLTEELDAKLTDFGVSRERQENTMTAGVGTMLWMAPEVMMADHYDEKADIFSFGVMLSELDLHSLPYSHARIDPNTGRKVPDAVILQKVATGALQVSFSSSCLASVVELAKECIALDPSRRPSAPMVVFRLQTIMKESFGE